MKKRPILLRLTVLAILIAAIWLKPMVSEWTLMNVLWKDYPETVKWELWNFRFQCAPYSPFAESWISRVEEEEDFPGNVREWLPEFVAFNDAASTNEHGYTFDFDASTPYFFKCQHDQYLLIWRTDHPSSQTNESMIVHVDEMTIWRHQVSIHHPDPEAAAE